MKLLSLINEGAYGKVYKWKKNDETVAVKKFSRKGSNFEHESLISFQTRNLKHSVKVYRSYADTTNGYMEMELCETDLFQVFQMAPVYKEKEAARLFFKICKAVEELHQVGIAHLDLKLENILINSNNEIKLCDFGSSLVFRHSTSGLVTPRKHVGTPLYVAPEFESLSKVVPPSADMWSLGILLHLIVVRCFPVHHHSVYIDNENLAFHHTTHLSSECQNLIRKLLTFDPQKRPTVQEVLKHPWLKLHKSHIKKNYAKCFLY